MRTDIAIVVSGYFFTLLDAWFAGLWFQEAITNPEPGVQFYYLVMSLWMIWLAVGLNRDTYEKLKRIYVK
jgi:hypothetical protein